MSLSAPLLLHLVFTGTLLFPAAPALFPGSVHEQAEELMKGGQLEQAVEMLRDHLKRTAGDAQAHELLGRCYIDLDRADEGAEQLSIAVDVLESEGNSRGLPQVKSLLNRTDRFAARRASFLQSLVKDFSRAAEKLLDEEQEARAMAILHRVLPLARGKQRAQVEKVLDKLAKATEAVDLDEAAEGDEADEGRELIELESEHYEIEANLEPEVVQLVADTMDDIYSSYVEIFLDGQKRGAKLPRAKIRIYPTWDAMVANHPNPSQGLGGWWSPGENKVTCYDTRDRSGSLDSMLNTLFHEASHQFTTKIARGATIPSWLNEGTACFFEGAVAMADHRVLWPDAAVERLMSLRNMLSGDSGPSLADVVGFEGGASYDGSYYPYGWGLVFFLQQWEDPESLEYSYRPLYRKYRDEVISRGGQSRALFDEIFLGEESPLGHTTFEEFEADWEQWILGEIAPLHVSIPEKLWDLRWAKAQRYLEAARTARGDKKAPIAEDELLKRALSHVEYLRRHSKLEGDSGRDLMLAQIEILERLEREKGEAQIIEQYLDGVDTEIFPMEEELYEKLEARLAKLDRGNWALRGAASKMRSYEKRALELLADYAGEGDEFLLRRTTLASQVSRALGSQGAVAEQAQALSERAREQGLLMGRIVALNANSNLWASAYKAPPDTFRVSKAGILIESVKPAAMIDLDLPLEGEYEVRATLDRDGDLHMGTNHGLVVAGTRDGDYIMVGTDDDGHGGLWFIRRRADTARAKRKSIFRLEQPVPEGVPVPIAVHLRPGEKMQIRIGDNDVIEARLPTDVPRTRHAGVYVRDGRMVVRDAVVEIYP